MSATSNLEYKSVAANGFTFRYREAGPPDGEVVLLLHGFPQSSFEWRSQQAALAQQGFRTIAPDQRGYSPGARPEAVEAYDRDTLEADMVAVADALGISQFHVVGHDWGAVVAWHLAANHPDRVRTATIISVPHPMAFASAIAADTEQQGKSGYIAVFRQEGHVAESLLLGEDGKGERMREMYAAWNWSPEAIDEYMSLLTEPGALTGALNWYRAIRFEDANLVDVTVPTTYIWSTDDMALGRAGAEATAAFCKGPYKFVVLDGVSHWVPEDEPERVTDEILERIRSV
jgi:pimeloyl-ACP methyl ester carboxylesterase